MVRGPRDAAFRELRSWDGYAGALLFPAPAEEGPYELRVDVRGYPADDADVHGSATVRAIHGAICQSATLAATYPGAGTQVNLAATAECGGRAAEYRFVARRPGSLAAVLREWGTDPFLAAELDPLLAGRWEYVVEARVAGRLRAEVRATAEVRVGASCSSVDLTAARVGTRVNLSAVASCELGVTPEYRFFARTPGAASWTQLLPYGADYGLAFAAPAGFSGPYEFHVQARAAGNASDFEAAASRTVLLGPTCSAATLTATPLVEPYRKLMLLDATATCTSGVTREFEYFVRKPSSFGFLRIQPYGPAAGAEWPLPYYRTGVADFLVRARAVGNVAPFDVEGVTTQVIPMIP